MLNFVILPRKAHPCAKPGLWTIACEKLLWGFGCGALEEPQKGERNPLRDRD